jgi:hypothetical protein
MTKKFDLDNKPSIHRVKLGITCLQTSRSDYFKLPRKQWDHQTFDNVIEKALASLLAAGKEHKPE